MLGGLLELDQETPKAVDQTSGRRAQVADTRTKGPAGRQDQEGTASGAWWFREAVSHTERQESVAEQP